MRLLDHSSRDSSALRLACCIGAHPIGVLIGALILFAGSLLGITRLSADFSHHGLFLESDPLLIEYVDFERRFGNDDSVVIAVSDEEGILDRESVALIKQISAQLEALPGVVQVSSAIAILQQRLAVGLPQEKDFDDLRPYAEIIKSTPLTGFVISHDQCSSLILAHMGREDETSPTAPQVMASVETVLGQHMDDHHQFHVTGAPAITAAFEQAASQDLEQLVPIALGATIIVALLLLRSILHVLIALSVVGLSTGSTLGIAGWLGIDMNNMTMAVPQILIAIGLATSLHLLVSFRHGLRLGQNSGVAAIHALEKNLKPTLLTSVTTAIGFFSLASSKLEPILGLGILAGCGTLMVWVFSYGFMGPLLFLTRSRSSTAVRSPSTRSLSERFLNMLGRRRLVIYAGYATICISSLVAVSKIEVNSDPLKYFATQVPVRVANEFVEREIGGARAIEVVVESGQPDGISQQVYQDQLAELRSWLESVQGITHIQGPNDSEENSNTEPRWISSNHDAVRLSVYSTISTSREVTGLVGDIRHELDELGLQGSVTGKLVLYQSMNGYVVSSFVNSMGLAFLLIATILVFALGSIRLGLLALLANLVPLLSGAAFLWLIGKPLDMGTVIAASVCLGIAVDDTIHILTGFSMARRNGKSPRKAVIEVLQHRTPALIMTTVILVLTFGAFVYGNFIPNVYFGILCAFILSLALATDLTVLPLLLSRSKDSKGKQGQDDGVQSLIETEEVA